MNKLYLRKLGRIGQPKNKSYYVTLPRDLVHEMGWADGWTLVIKRAGKQRRIILQAEEPWLKEILEMDDNRTG